MIDGFHPASTLIPVSRLTGVTTALVSPGQQSVIAGQAAIVDLAGGRRQDMAIEGAEPLRINLGGVQANAKDSATLSTRMGRVAYLRSAFLAAQEYARKLERHEKEFAHFQAEQAHEAAKAGSAGGTGDGSAPGRGLGSSSGGTGGTGTGGAAEADEEDEDFPPLKLPPEPPARDLKKEALVAALRRERKVFARAHRADDIRAALALAKEFDLDLVVVHGTEAWKLADDLAARDVPVIVGPVNTQPDSFETLGARYDNAALLYRAGVRVAIQTADSHNVRNLPYMAGLAVVHGLPRVEALAACTIEAARILGIDDRYGSIEIEKVANLVIVEGDIFQPRSKVRHIMVRGRDVPLTSRQTELADRYRSRRGK
jgi:imidazolonepropionase-like amidohydrolase